MAKHLPHILDLCIVEMVVRAAKHVLKLKPLTYTMSRMVVAIFVKRYDCGHLPWNLSWTTNSHGDNFPLQALVLVTCYPCWRNQMGRTIFRC